MNERILIIEDDQAILKLLQRGLAYEGYTVDTAIDGRMGLIAARDHTPDLVILDWMLPGMDGLEVCHRLRMASGSVPVLMLTAKEYELLELFLRHPKQVLTREFIFDRVWGYDFGGESNVLEVYIRYLRQKLEEGGEVRLIHTVRGVGYVMRENP